MRDSSVRIVRMYSARGGASIPSAARPRATNGTSFANVESQSMRLMSVVICGYVRYSVSFS